MIGARLRHNRGWSDARILNLSSRGLLVRVSETPPSGSYVEICRGTHRIVARVVWADNDRFGAHSQDAIAVDAIIGGDDAAPAPAADAGGDRRRTRRLPSLSERQEKSRRRSRQLEFICVTVFGCAAAAYAFDTVRETLSKPLSMVEARLGKG